MKLLVDSADTKAIAKLCDYYPIDGVTTNPTILLKAGRKPDDVLREIRSIIGEKDLHIQVVSLLSEDIIAEARTITEAYGSDTFVKIPVTLEGVKAIKKLSSEGFRCTGTAIYTLEQAYLAAHAGAQWIAPYVNRIETIYGDGVGTVCQMQEMLDNNGYTTGILAASFHRIDQITALIRRGIAAATIGPDLLFALLNNPNVDKAVSDFTSDYKKLVSLTNQN